MLFRSGALDAGDVLVETRNSEATGSFTFSVQVTVGNYLVTYTLPSGWSNTGSRPRAFTIAVNDTQASTAGKNLFTRQGDLTISGTVIDDADASGAVTVGESGITAATVTVSLYADTNRNGAYDAGTDLQQGSSQSGSSGVFSWTGLAPQTYFVRKANPVDWVSTGSIVGTGSSTATTTDQFKVNLAAPISADPADAGVSASSTANVFLVSLATATIAGTVYSDLDGDGAVTAGDVVRSGVTVYVDSNNSGTLDGSEKSATSGADGAYLLTGLTAGSPKVRTVPGTGWSATGTTPLVVTLGTGAATATGKDLFTQQGNLVISGFVYEDLNADGVNNSSTVLCGSTITLYRDSRSGGSQGIFDPGTDLQVGSPVTLAGGCASSAWSFTNLTPGKYFVAETDPTNFASTNAVPGGGGAIKDSSNRFLVVLTSSSSTNNQFLDTNAQGSISGYVYNDLNGNGKADSTKKATDAPLAGSVISLYRDRGSLGVLEVGVTGAPDELVATVTVGAAGTWTFTGLIYDTYLVTQSTITTGYGATGVIAPPATGPGSCSRGCTAISTNLLQVNLAKAEAVGSTSTLSRAAVFLDQSADYTILVSDGTTTVSAGTTVTYTITVRNVGPYLAPSNAAVTDIIPANTTASFKANQPNGTCTTVTYSDAETPAALAVQCTTNRTLGVYDLATGTGDQITFEVSLDVDPAFDPAVDLDNRVIVTGSTPDSNPDNDSYLACAAGQTNFKECNESARDVDDVVATADLALTGAPTTVVAGTTLTYTYTVTNGGPSVARSVTLAETLPTNTSQFSWGGVAGAGQYCVNFTGSWCATAGNWTTFSTSATIAMTDVTYPYIGATPATKTRTVSIRFDVPADVLSGVTYLNSATVGTTGATDPVAANNTAAVTTTVTTHSDLSIAVTTPTATDPAYGSGTDTSSYLTAGLYLSYDVTVTNAGPSVDKGFTLRRLASAFDAQDYASMSYCVLVSGACPGSFTTLSADELAAAAQVDILGPRLTVGASATIRVRFDVRSGAGITGRGTPVDVLTNSFQALTGSDLDPVAGNNAKAQNTRIKRVTDLSTDVSAAATVNAGTTLTYTVAVTNAGPSDDTDALVRVTLPANSGDYGTVTYCVAAAGSATCTPSTTLAGTYVTIGSIEKAATRTFLVALPVKSAALNTTALAFAATSYTSTPVDVVNGDNLDPSPTYDTDGVTPTVTTLSDLKVEQTAPITLNPASWMAAGALIAGTTLQYTVTVTNLGPSDDLTAGVVATLTDGVDYTNLRYCVQLTITSCATEAAFTGFASGAELPVAGGTLGSLVMAAPARSILIRAAVPSDRTPPAATITATTTVGSSASDQDGAPVDGATGNNTATSATAITTDADVQVTITSTPASGTTVRIDEAVVYKIGRAHV